jgi:hypothetical protein
MIKAKRPGARVIIRNRRFMFVYPDGQIEGIRMSERAKAHLGQLKTMDVRNANQ